MLDELLSTSAMSPYSFQRLQQIPPNVLHALQSTAESDEVVLDAILCPLLRALHTAGEASGASQCSSGLLLGLAVHQTRTCWHEDKLPGSPWQPGIRPAFLGYGPLTETSSRAAVPDPSRR